MIEMSYHLQWSVRFRCTWPLKVAPFSFPFNFSNLFSLSFSSFFPFYLPIVAACLRLGRQIPTRNKILKPLDKENLRKYH